MTGSAWVITSPLFGWSNLSLSPAVKKKRLPACPPKIILLGQAGNLTVPSAEEALSVMAKQMFVYILTNKVNSVLYTGVTRNLKRRVYEHKEKIKSKFTARYNVNKLVYYEVFSDSYNAIAREKQIKAGSRQKKINLIDAMNPGWIDLYDGIWDCFVPTNGVGTRNDGGMHGHCEECFSTTKQSLMYGKRAIASWRLRRHSQWLTVRMSLRARFLGEACPPKNILLGQAGNLSLSPGSKEEAMTGASKVIAAYPPVPARGEIK
jgi:putative endonuclease